MKKLGELSLLACLTLAAPARAQETDTTAPAETTASPAPTPASPAPVLCVPACRSGFVCITGQCVSACNPPCSAGMSCTSTGECLAPPSAPPVAVNAAPAPAPYAQPPQPWGPPSTAAPAWQDSATERPSEPVAGVRFHDGFYFRLGLGGGALGANVEQNDTDDPTPVHVGGVAIPVELALGGTPAPGVVLGAGVYGVHLPAARYTVGRGDYVEEGDADYGALSMVGPFIDVYVHPRLGIHFQAAPGFVAVNAGASDDLDSDELSGTGFGAMVGAGIESWVGEQWSMGVLARLQYASVELEDESGDTYDFETLIPGLLVTATLH
jgi:hypothetical protein